MNWIVCPCRNNLHLTRRAVESFRRQDLPNIKIMIIDNGSTDGTRNWLRSQRDLFREWHPGFGRSVAASWNGALSFLFDQLHEEYALVVNNDVELNPWTYRLLLVTGGLFVTAVGVQDRQAFSRPPNPAARSPHPDFSCFLIRRAAWERVGRFDEQFRTAFCEDWDYHVRLHRAGIEAISIDVPYLHHASQTIKNADEAERERIGKQADENREYFRRKWGFAGGSEEYNAFFRQEVLHEP